MMRYSAVLNGSCVALNRMAKMNILLYSVCCCCYCLSCCSGNGSQYKFASIHQLFKIDNVSDFQAFSVRLYRKNLGATEKYWHYQNSFNVNWCIDFNTAFEFAGNVCVMLHCAWDSMEIPCSACNEKWAHTWNPWAKNQLLDSSLHVAWEWAPHAYNSSVPKKHSIDITMHWQIKNNKNTHQFLWKRISKVFQCYVPKSRTLQIWWCKSAFSVED